MKRFIVFFLFLLFFLTGITYAATYPDYAGYVNDFAHVLSPQYVTDLNGKLTNFNHQTTNQIAVVTVGTTQPETIEEYSIHLADKWKVGQKGKDNGIIMLFSMKDHMMRIEVGRGLEGDLTDIQSKHIQQDTIVPEFKKGNYEQGITNGVDAVITTITHGNVSPNTINSTPPAQSDSLKDVLIRYSPFIFFLLFFLLSTAFSPKTKLGGRGAWGINTFWGDSGGSSSTGGGDTFGGGGFSGGGSSDSW